MSPPNGPTLCLVHEFYLNGNVRQYLAENPNVDRRKLVCRLEHSLYHPALNSYIGIPNRLRHVLPTFGGMSLHGVLALNSIPFSAA